MNEILKILMDASAKIDDVVMDLYLLDNPEGENLDLIRLGSLLKNKLDEIIAEASI